MGSNDEDAKWETALKSQKSRCNKNEKAHLEGKHEAHFGAKYLNLMWLFTLLSGKIRVLNCTGYLLCIHLWGQTATEQIQLGHSLFQSDWCYYQFPSNFPCSGPDDQLHMTIVNRVPILMYKVLDWNPNNHFSI